MKLVLDVLASYIDYYEEYSTNFLRHVTAFIRDLDIDCNKNICAKLSDACNRFVKNEANQELVNNILSFTKYNFKEMQYKSHFDCCSICTAKGMPNKSV